MKSIGRPRALVCLRTSRFDISNEKVGTQTGSWFSNAFAVPRVIDVQLLGQKKSISFRGNACFNFLSLEVEPYLHSERAYSPRVSTCSAKLCRPFATGFERSSAISGITRGHRSSGLYP